MAPSASWRAARPSSATRRRPSARRRASPSTSAGMSGRVPWWRTSPTTTSSRRCTGTPRRIASSASASAATASTAARVRGRAGNRTFVAWDPTGAAPKTLAFVDPLPDAATGATWLPLGAALDATARVYSYVAVAAAQGSTITLLRFVHIDADTGAVLGANDWDPAPGERDLADRWNHLRTGRRRLAAPARSHQRKSSSRRDRAARDSTLAARAATQPAAPTRRERAAARARASHANAMRKWPPPTAPADFLTCELRGGAAAAGSRKCESGRRLMYSSKRHRASLPASADAARLVANG